MAKETRSLSGRVVAITGAARGIGAATATALARRGAKVAIGDLDVELAEETAAGLGGEAIALPVNVIERESFEGFLAQVEERLGPLDVLINNAGIMPISRIVDEDDAAARRIIDIDLHGVILGTKLAAERMVPRGAGHIVNIASQAGKAGFPGLATYCAAKHGVVGFSQSVAGELKGTGVEISYVMPGVVNTELTSGVTPARGVKNVEPEEVAEEIVSALEQPRLEVHVPRSLAVVGRFVYVLPQRGREFMARVFRSDRMMLEADRAQRAAYEARAAASAAEAEERAAESEAEAEDADAELTGKQG